MDKVRWAVFSALFSALSASGCTEGPPFLEPEGKGEPTLEHELGQKLAAVRGDPDAVRAFLADMPKGADLHSHIAGAVRTESFIEWGSEDGVCLDMKTLSAVYPPCGPGAVPLADAVKDSAVYADVIAAWSMEGYDGPLLGAHKHFFDTFGRFLPAFGETRGDDALAEVMSTAGKNKQLYVELLSGLSAGAVGAVASKYMKETDTWSEEYLLAKREQIMADPVFSTTIAATKTSIPSWISGARKLLGCDTDNPDPGCGVSARYLMSATRTQDRASVFAQWVYGFELVQAAPEVVGVNLVAPEENENSLRYYDDEMMALDVLRRHNEGDAARRPVHISLHAGELISEVLPNTVEGKRHLKFHIRRAVELAGAERIGHGADLAHESEDGTVFELLAEMRAAGVLVEICLTSNDELLGIAGKRHPLSMYLAHDVPVALATDDQGIFRTEILDEYVRAVELQGLSYWTLKNMVRASLEHAFVGGESIWKTKDSFIDVVDVCAEYPLGFAEIPAACADFIAGSERATLQWQLEADFKIYEEAARAK
jgi:adenosine deaminase